MEVVTPTSSPEAVPVHCDACGGRGEVNQKACHHCRGLGRGFFLDGYLLVWEFPLTPEAIRGERWRYAVRWTIRALAFGLCFFGLLIFALEAVSSAARGVSVFAILSRSDLLGFIFWSSILAQLFLFYSLERDTERAHRIPRRRYRQVKPPEGALWSINFARYPRVELWHTLTVSAQSTLLLATKHSLRESRHVGGVDIFLECLQKQGIRFILRRLGIKVSLLVERTARAKRSGQFPESARVEDIVARAYALAYTERQLSVDVGHLFAAVGELDPLVREVLLDVDVTPAKMKNVLLWQQSDERLQNKWRRYSVRAKLRPRNRLDRAMTAVATPTVDHFSVDYTERAQWGELPPTIERTDVVERVLQAMDARRSVLLVGSPGVGKGGVIANIAERMVANDVPDILKDKRLVSISLASLVGGATPAEAEGRLLAVLAEANRSGNIVFVLEEVQGLIGITSGGAGSVDLGSVLASTLTASGLLCLATTTPEAYRQFVEPTSLAQTLERVDLPEPSVDETIRVIESRLGVIEYRHHVLYSYDAVARLVELTARFIHDQFLPKKALAVLDELSQTVRAQKGEYATVLAVDVDAYLAAKLGIPATTVGADESVLLLALEDQLHERVVGQDEAIVAVSNALRRARTQIRDRRRPVASFLFLGPTGVGKTELAKALASVYFGDDQKMVRLDMTEYQELSSLSRLIGGEGRRGTLTEAVRKSPFALLLVDEIEKAHHDVINLFLQVMDDGRLTDGTGQTIDFTNVIIIATSNAGAVYIQDALKRGETMENISRQLLEAELRSYFQPEFLNRFDGMVVFRPLTLEQVATIAGMLLAEVGKRLASEHGILFEATPAGVAMVANEGFDPLFGARPLRRVIQNRIDAELARMILEHRVARRDTIRLEADGRLVVQKAAAL